MHNQKKTNEWAANLQVIADQMITEGGSNDYLANQAVLLNRIAAEILVDTPHFRLH